MSLFPGLLNDYLEVSQGGKGLIGVPMVIADLFQNSTRNTMFGHSTRNSLDLVTTTSRFLHDDSYCDMITRYGPSSKVVRNMRIAMKITRLSHWYMIDRPVDTGQNTNRTISGGILLCKVWLCNFKSVRKKKEKKKAVFTASPSVMV